MHPTFHAFRILGAAALLLLITIPAAAQQAGFHPDQVRERPLLWPDTVATTEDLSDGRQTIRAGTALKVQGVEADGVVVAMPNGELTLLPFELTDFTARAAARAEELPEEARNLTLADLLTRTDLLPPKVTLTEEIRFPDKVRGPGTDIGPYKVTRSDTGDFVLIAIDPEVLAQGVAHQRQLYSIGSTDFMARLREQFSGGEEKRESRLLSDLKGRLVDASGNSVPDAEKPARYYVIYYGAGWCGWCQRFDPSLVSFYDEIKAEHPDVEAVYVSADHSGQEMLEHMQKAGLKFPAVRYEDRLKVPFLLGLVSGSTPHVVVVTSEGRLVHDGTPAGMNGAQAALAALKAELAKQPAPPAE